MSVLSPIHPHAVQMINVALSEIVRKGGKVERMHLHVCPRSELAQHQVIQTAFGYLRIHLNDFVPKGYSYVLEDPGGDKRGFAWVSIPKDARIMENRQKEA
ncbi:hypothetical protein BSK66_31615 [Paenibacillus odorifer]|uniref:Uncharacterized protein n=1 Tax=Paenibacillus odorifer TaxID=189426 RepID=A0A1R0XBB9_9BACL|nr:MULTISPECIES: hypothetical protein [Paenibacillus]ETT61242.1 hypothetical protein C171_12708 [Paenibacillus sp. FSL H8-237]OMD32210.1 hypothetical protein BJP51_16665 [Paenibacillus odorifer]OME46772.1 hypothetical protein BSK66_31615 [Paenibacillus odorifer]